jgi:hypothetical protein
MAITKTSSLPRPPSPPKHAPAAQASAQQPPEGGAGHASAPQGGSKPNAKPLDGFSENGGRLHRQSPSAEVHGLTRATPNQHAGESTGSKGDNGAYDLGGAFDKAFGQGLGETKPGSGWGDQIRKHQAELGEKEQGSGWVNLLEKHRAELGEHISLSNLSDLIASHR